MLHNLLNNILKKKLYLIITVFVVLVVGISLGSAILTKTLSIGGKTKIDNKWIIYFDKVVLNNNSVTNDDTSKDAKIVDFEKQNIEFSANLSSVGDFYEFDVYTVNDGDIDVMIDSIDFTGLEGKEEYINYNVNYDDATLTNGDEYYSNKYTYSSNELKPCDPLYGETRRKIKVRVSLKKELEDDEPISLNLGFKINYTQYESDCASKHTLTIDPNGGLYSNTSTTTKIYLSKDQTYTVNVPTKGDQEFLGWEVIPSSGTYTFDSTLTTEQQFKMGEEDVNLRAKWNDEITEDYVARIEDTYYTTIQKAFDDVDKGWSDNTVHLLRDTTENAVNNATSPFVFDLETHTVTGIKYPDKLSNPTNQDDPINHDNYDESNTLKVDNKGEINPSNEIDSEEGYIITATITNSKNGNMTLSNGRIISYDDNDSGTINTGVINFGTLTMSDNTDDVQVENSISIVGNNHGLINSNNSYFNFYDGYIDANILPGEEGTAYLTIGEGDDREQYPNGYSLIIDTIPTGTRAYLTRDPSRAVAKTLTNGVKYFYNLQLAINWAEENKATIVNSNSTHYKIYVIRSFDSTQEINYDENQDIYIDLSGFNISLGESFTNSGNIFITNSNENSDSIISTFKTIVNNGSLNIDNKVDFTASNDLDIIQNNGLLDIEQSIFTAKKGYAIKNSTYTNKSEGEEYQRIKLGSDTVIKGSTYGIYNESDDLVLDNGTIYGLYNKSIDNAHTITAELKDDVIIKSFIGLNSANNSANFEAIYNCNNCTLNINGGNISSDFNKETISNFGTINMYDGDILSKSIGVKNGILNLFGGTIKSTDTYATNSELYMKGGTLISDSDVAAKLEKAIIDDGYLNGVVAGLEVVGINVVVNGGTIESDNIGIISDRNYNNSKVVINGGTIEGHDIGAKIGKKESTIEINGGEIIGHNPENEHSTSKGVLIETNGTATVTGGIIKGDWYGLHNQNIVTLGVDNYNENGKAMVNIDKPILIGGTYGLYIDNDKTTNFYDGILKGVTDGYEGEITNLPLGTVIGEDQETIDDKLYNTDFVVIYKDWLSVDGVTYNNLSDASKAIDSEGTILVIDDADIVFSQMFINNDINNKKITFDLNGHKITSTQTITNDVILTIIDSSDDKSGTYISSFNDGFINNNSMTINGGNYTSNSTTTTAILNKGNLTINSATFNVDNTAITNKKDLVINDINVINSNNAINNSQNVTINAGTINASNNGIENQSGARNVIMNGGTINAGNMGIGGHDGNITITADSIVNSVNYYGLYSYEGKIIVKDNAKVTSQNSVGIFDHSNIYVYDNVSVTGKVGIENKLFCYTKIHCEARDIYVYGGTITGTDTNGINSQVGVTSITGGTIKGKKYGVNANSKVTIGIYNNSINIESPVLIGDEYGINAVSGAVSFFDGVLKGINDGHIGLINEIPDSTMIIDDREYIGDTQYKIQYLDEYGNWLKVGDNEYNSINDAIRDTPNGGTMIVIANPYIGFGQTIPEGKDVNLNLNGHSLIMTQPITVEGKLTIVDSTEPGDELGGSINGLMVPSIYTKEHGTSVIEKGIYSSQKNETILNEGTLIINDGKFLSDEDYGIRNSGSFTLNNGTIKTFGGIYNSGYFTMNNGYIEGESKASIYTEGGTIIMNNGSIVKNIKGKSSENIDINGGTLTINNGTITSNIGTGINVSRTNFTVNGGNIYGIKKGINLYLGTNTINDGIIKSDENGVYMYESNLTVIDGLIEGGLYGIYNSSLSTLTLGIDDYGVNDLSTLSQTAPEVRGGSYAVYNYNKFNFYDGILKGNTTGDTDSYYGVLTAIPNGVTLVYGEEETYKSTLTLEPEKDIAENLTTHQRYIDLRDAISEASENDIVQLINYPNTRNIVSIFYSINNTNENKITLDLNGVKLLTNKDIVNNGNLSIINTNDNEATIRQIKSSTNFITNNASLKLSNLNISAERNDRKIQSTSNIIIEECIIDISVNLSNIIKIDNSTITTNSSSNPISITSKTNSEINDSNINGLFKSYGSGSLTITNSTINDGSMEIKYGEVQINNSTLNKNLITIGDNSVVTMEDTNVLINGSTAYEHINNISTLNINNSNIIVNYKLSTEKLISNSGNLNINDSNIKYDYRITGDTVNTKDIIALTSYKGNLSLINTNIDIIGARVGTGILLIDNNNGYNTIVKFNSGTVNIDKTNRGTGVSIEKGTFILGEEDDDELGNNVFSSLEYDNPKIYVSSSRQGIGVSRTNGSFNFHDGIVWGSSNSIPDSVSKTPLYHEVTTYIEKTSGFRYSILEDMRHDYEGTAVARIGKIYYSLITDAIKLAKPGDEIVLLQSTSEDLNIDVNKNIRLNLNSKDLTTTITNHGTINVYGGLLHNIDSTVVVNEGTFIMGQDDGNVSSSNIKVISSTNAVDNRGTFIMNDGYVEGTTTFNGNNPIIVENARLYTANNEQSEVKYLVSLSQSAIEDRLVDLILTIDPKEGYYDGSKDIKEVYLKYEDTYELLEPTKDNAIFDGWESTDPDNLVEDIVTIGLNDVTVSAKWIPNNNVVATNGDKFYTSLADAINESDSGDTIKLLKDTTENITNDKNTTLDLNNHKVTGEFINNGELVLLNGIIENTNGIGLTNNNKLIMGINDDSVNDSVKIIGSTIGLKQSGIFNYYDGYIEGINPIEGNVSSLPKNYYLTLSINNSLNRISLSSNTNKVAAINNGNNILYFDNLNSAIDQAINLGKEIDIIKDFESAENINISDTSNIIINLNSYDIILGGNINNSGTLKIYDNSDNIGSINIVKTITNNGTLNLNNITINQTTSDDTILNNGTLNINSCNINSNDGYAINNNGNLTIDGDSMILSNGYSLYNNSENTITIESAKFSGIKNDKSLVLNNVEIENNDVNNACISMETQGATLVINNGIYSSTGIGILLNEKEQSVEINGGIINSVNDSIKNNENNSTITINGGEITSSQSRGIVNTDYSTLNITDGIISGATYGVYNKYTDMTMTGGKIISSANDSTYYALYLNSCNHNSDVGKNINISGSSIIQSENASGVSNASYCNMNINGVEIVSNASDGYGIYNYGSLNIDGNSKLTTTGISSIGLYDKGTTTIKNIDLKSNNIGIENYIADMNIYGGTISGAVYGLKFSSGVNNEITVNIGNPDDELSTTNPYITGGLYGVYKTRDNITLNYYGGKLRGSVYGYYGDFNNIRSKKEIIEENEEIDISNTLTYSTTDVSVFPTSNYAKEGNGYARITYLGETSELCENGKEYNFDYKGIEVIFVAPCTGKYKLETWGAQGGTNSSYSSHSGGYGGYSTGNIDLTYGEKLYINVGGQGSVTNSDNPFVYGGYNGGGSTLTNESSNSYFTTSGGGATSIAFSSGELYQLENNRNSIVIVSGGGAGIYYSNSSYTYTQIAGQGGGYIGSDSTAKDESYTAKGGTQEFGYAFGRADIEGHDTMPGAGGGYYGGYTNCKTAGGGSGYIGNTRLYDKYMYGYNIDTSVDGYINNYLINKADFLKIGNNTYNSFESAFEDYNDGDNIIVINDSNISESTTIPSDKNIVIDLNGHTINSTRTMINNGSLIFKDTVGTGLYNNTMESAIENYGNLELNNINIKAKMYGIDNKSSNKNIVLNNTKIQTDSDLLNFSSTGEGNVVTINDSTITSNGMYGINISSTPSSANEFNITNSKIESSRIAILSRTSNFVISNSEISVSEGNNYTIQSTYSNITISNNSKINSDISNGINISNGKLTINDSETTSKLNAIICGSNSELEINGNSTITTSGTNSSAIKINNISTININNGTITSKNIGIEITGSNVRTIDINGGTINAGKYGIYIKGDNTTINIGNKDAELSIENPSISGDEYAIYKDSGVSNFYNGKLRGKLGGYNGDFNTVRNGMKIYETFDFDIPGDMDSKYIVNYLIDQEGYLQVGDNIYNSFDKAIEALGNSASGTISVVSSLTIEDAIEIDGNDITLDLNGHRLMFSDTIVNNANLTIIDSQTNGKIKGNIISSKCAITNNNILNVNSGTIESNGMGICTDTDGHTLNINGGIIETNNYSIYYDSNAYSNTLNISNGDITSNNSYAIYDNCSNNNSDKINTINISGGTITGATYGAYLKAVKGRINGGTISTTSTNTSNYALYLANSKNLYLDTGSLIKADNASGIYINGGPIYLSGVEVNINSSNAFGVNINTGPVTINNGTKITAKGIGISQNAGTLNVNGGSISGDTYGVQMNGGTLNVSKSILELSSTNPYITGGLYAIDRTTGGTINYYGGKLRGITGTSSAGFSSIRTGYYVNEQLDEDNYVVANLIEAIDTIENKQTGTKYKTLSSALSEIENNQELKLIANIYNFDNITISNTKNISIDLNGYNLYTSKKITNNGILSIKNSTDNESKLYSGVLSDTLLVNANELSLDNIKIANKKGSITNNSNKVLNINNSIIESNETAINNSGYMTINKSNITGVTYGIYDTSSVSNSVTNSTISSSNIAIYKKNGATLTIGDNTTINGTITIDSSSSNVTINNSNINDTITNKGTLTISGSNINSDIVLSGTKTIISNTSTMIINNNTFNVNVTSSSSSSGELRFINNDGTLESSNNIYTIKEIDENKYKNSIVILNNKIAISNNDTFNIYNFKNGYTLRNNNANANLTINSIKVNSHDNSVSQAISNTNGNTRIYGNSELNIYDSETSYGIYTSSGTVNFESGTINAQGSTAYGIYTNNSSGILKIGIDDENVSITNPKISAIGITNGIGLYRSNGTIYFYDGYIIGSNNVTNFDISLINKPSGYSINTKFDNETGYNYIILEEE